MHSRCNAPKTNVPCITICTYYNKSSKSRWIVLEFLKVDDTSEKYLFNYLIDAISKLELEYNNIRGQGYDDGSNMIENIKKYKKDLNINSRSFYTPCGAII